MIFFCLTRTGIKQFIIFGLKLHTVSIIITYVAVGKEMKHKRGKRYVSI